MASLYIFPFQAKPYLRFRCLKDSWSVIFSCRTYNGSVPKIMCAHSALVWMSFSNRAHEDTDVLGQPVLQLTGYIQQVAMARTWSLVPSTLVIVPHKTNDFAARRMLQGIFLSFCPLSSYLLIRNWPGLEQQHELRQSIRTWQTYRKITSVPDVVWAHCTSKDLFPSIQPS